MFTMLLVHHCGRVYPIQKAMWGTIPELYRPRCLGSKMSRRASPAKAKPITVTLMNMPGKMSIQGEVAMYWAACPVSIRPQEGVGSQCRIAEPSAIPFADDRRSLMIIETD